MAPTIHKRPVYCENHTGRCPTKQLDPDTGRHNCEGCVWVQAPPATPPPCHFCDAGDESFGVQCYNCGNTFHVHQAQLRKIAPGLIVAAVCPYCRRSNAWRRTDSGIEYSGPIYQVGEAVQDVKGAK